MQQILQSLNTGKIQIEETPTPNTTTGNLLIQTHNTLISAGTERMLLEFGKAGLLGKIKQQPDKVKMVLDKIKTDGLFTTLEAVKSKLDQPIPLGYSNVGHVLEVGKDVEGFTIGDRVLSNGPHAGIVRSPKNLCAKIPENVSDEEAIFTVLGAIALQGIRLAGPTLGECFVVTGLGLIGLVTVQLLRAQGCRVLGIDFDPEKLKLAQSFGAEVVDLSQGQDPIAIANQFSRGRGVDGVIITAATQSNEPMHQAATMCRKRGRIILVGVTGLELSRADFFEKELTFQVSCSYGPGRYDENYEQKGQDYPVGFVRWTEQRNFEAVLDMISSGQLDVKPLLSHRFDITEADKAYQALSEDKTVLGIALNYPQDQKPTKTVKLTTQENQTEKVNSIKVGFIGAGNYAGRVLVPAFKAASAALQTIVSSQGVTGVLNGKKHGFAETTTDTASVFSNEQVNVVAIATRHNQHADQVIQALNAGKHVFVEKPLALTLEELIDIEKAYKNAKTAQLMVGFNRRFAPQVQKIKSLLKSSASPKSFVMTVNAGAIPKDHWTQDNAVGGGRIIGEACHFIDLLRFLAGSKIVSHHAVSMSGLPQGEVTEDKATITLTFEDGSIGMIHYLANGHKSFSKERLEVFYDEKILQLDNFRKLTGFGVKGFKKMNLWQQDKGQNACAKAFVSSLKSGQNAPIAFDELIEVSKATIEITGQLQR